MNEKKRILHVIESSETGGAESIFLKIILGIESSFDHYVVLFEHGWLAEQLSKKNIPYSVILTNKSYDLFLLFNIVKLIRSLNIELIHSHLFGANVYSSICGAICKVPIICTFHGMVDVSETDRFLRLKFFILKKFASRIVFVSENLKNVFHTKFHVNLHHSMVIYNGTDLHLGGDTNEKSSILRKKLECDEETFLIVAVGDVRRAKGYNILIEAAKKLVKIGDYKFAIAGTVTELCKEYKCKIKENGLADVFFFLGHQNDIRPVLYAGDVYVLPSLTEGFSIATIEAMAARIPVAVTASGGPEEIITHNYNGMILPVNSSDAIVASIVSLRNDINKREFFTDNAYHDVIGRFSMEKMLCAYTRLYRDLMS